MVNDLEKLSEAINYAAHKGDWERFQDTAHKVLTVTILEDGSLQYLRTDACDVLLELGEAVTRRASHVEPADLKSRILFHCLRTLVSDKSRVAAWTRTWTCKWRVNTAPVGGPILSWRDVWRTSGGVAGDEHNWPDGEVATFDNRQTAIDAEVMFLNEFFLTR